MPEPETSPFGIGMTDEEVYNLAMQRADELHSLFIDFLQYQRTELIFDFDNDYENSVWGKIFVADSGEEYDEFFYVITDDRFNTLDDIFAIFNQTCTPEYSEELLKYSRGIQYREIDGELCFADTVLTRGAMETIKGGEFVSFEVTEDQIKLNFTVFLYFDDPAFGEYCDYSIYLKNVDGEWLISGCTDMHKHGYYWSAASQNDDEIQQPVPELLRLLGCYIDDNGDVVVNPDWDAEIDRDTYEKYFYGEWRSGYMTDTDESFFWNDSNDKNPAGEIYKIDDNIILFIDKQTEREYLAGYPEEFYIYWIDTDNPNMYYLDIANARDDGLWWFFNAYEEYEVPHMVGYMYKVEGE